MISIARLIQNGTADLVAFDKYGEALDITIPDEAGHATLMVTPLTDAVKRVEGDVIESLDRDQMWTVEALVLDRAVLRRLDAQELTVENLLVAVGDLGYEWQVIPTSSP